MDFGDSDGSEIAVCGLCRGACERDRPQGSGRSAARLLHGADAAVRAQERGADGGGDGAGANCGAAPVAVAFCRRGRLVGRAGVGQGARDGVAGDRAAGADRGLDHRRYGLSQAGAALGRGGAAILWAARQAGQLPGGGVAVAGQPPCQPAGGLSALSAARVGGTTARGGARRGVPEEIAFATKPEIALEQLRWACAAGLPRGVVLIDAGYGNNSALRADITALDLTYVAGILSTTTVWAPGTAPLPPKRWSGRGRPTTRLRRDAKHQPVSVKELALGLSKRAWRTIEWREGTAEPLVSRFARVRIRVAHRDDQRADPRPQEWLLIEWPKGEAEPTKYWLSTLPNDIAFDRLVDLAKLRWRIERDYQELKQEVGLGHFEGRGWRGFHHHATLCIAAYGFLISERETIPPSGPRSAGCSRRLAVSDGYRPRGAAVAARASHPKLDRNHAPPPDRRSGQNSATMSMLLSTNDKTLATQEFVMQ